MADIHWIKLKTSMFDDEKIRLIEAMPEADSILIIWVRLLVLAGKTNDDGLIYIQRDMPYTDEALATLFNKKINVVRLALTTLSKFQMIDVEENGTLQVNNWEKHQNVEQMEHVRNLAAERNRRYRENKKTKQIGDVSRDVSVTSRDATDSDSESDTEVNKDNVFPWQSVIDYLNEKTGKHFKHTAANKTVIMARHKEGYTADDMRKVIDNKTAEWLKDAKMNKFLQPSTLFRASKFEGYVNNIPVQEQSSKMDLKDWTGD
ncbi:phage replisome organizer N-terminal domain-containing protein [Furfurilactobacillus entadae]|uniref:phage replisome organizer N-terminal domain-containing protein n=1 Tax=Furfurilactobacillus entadae TaxID=2922307 RepID=UPI0035E78C2A